MNPTGFLPEETIRLVIQQATSVCEPMTKQSTAQMQVATAHNLRSLSIHTWCHFDSDFTFLRNTEDLGWCNREVHGGRDELVICRLPFRRVVPPCGPRVSY